MSGRPLHDGELRDATGDFRKNEQPENRCCACQNRIENQCGNDKPRARIHTRKLHNRLPQSDNRPDYAQHTHNMNKHHGERAHLEHEAGSSEADLSIDSIKERNYGFGNKGHGEGRGDHKIAPGGSANYLSLHRSIPHICDVPSVPIPFNSAIFSAGNAM